MDGPKGNPAGALVFLLVALMGLALFVVFVSGEPVPAQYQLVRVTSDLQDLSYVGGKNETLHLRLAGQPLGFSVPSQAGDLEALSDTLETASGPVTILYDVKDRRHPWFASEDEDFYLVYALARGEDQILSYEQARKGFDDDRVFGLWFAPVWLLVSGYMMFLAWRVWKPKPVRRHADSP